MNELGHRRGEKRRRAGRRRAGRSLSTLQVDAELCKRTSQRGFANVKSSAEGVSELDCSKCRGYPHSTKNRAKLKKLKVISERASQVGPAGPTRDDRVWASTHRGQTSLSEPRRVEDWASQRKRRGGEDGPVANKPR